LTSRSLQYSSGCPGSSARPRITQVIRYEPGHCLEHKNGQLCAPKNGVPVLTLGKLDGRNLVVSRISGTRTRLVDSSHAGIMYVNVRKYVCSSGCCVSAESDAFCRGSCGWFCRRVGVEPLARAYERQRGTPVAAVCIFDGPFSTEFNSDSALWHQSVSPLASGRLGIRLSHSVFGLQGHQRLLIHTEDMSMFASGLISMIGKSYAQRTWLRHRASCRDAAQYYQKAPSAIDTQAAVRFVFVASVCITARCELAPLQATVACHPTVTRYCGLHRHVNA